MASNLFPSIENRLHSLIELGRRNAREHGVARGRRIYPTVTLTREFGCEGFPVAQRLKELLEQQSGLPWLVMDKALLEAVAQDHQVSEEVLRNLGTKNRFIDDMLSTFSPRWRSDKECYRLLVRQIMALAEVGNVILVGRGAAILTQGVDHCFHFRIVAPHRFKVASIVKRLSVDEEEAQRLVAQRQQQRDAFVKDFLGRDLADPTLYHLILNNARCSVEKMARICHCTMQNG